MGECKMDKREYDVLVVSGSPELRESLKMVLEKDGKLAPDRIGEAKDEGEAVKTIDGIVSAGGKVGVVIEDLGMRDGGKGCAELLAYVQANHPKIPVIVLSIYASAQPAANASIQCIVDALTQRIEDESKLTVSDSVLKLGAFAYLPKDRPLKELIGWVHHALYGVT